MITRPALAALLWWGATIPAAEPPATSHAAFLSGPQWRVAIQTMGMCWWWETYERTNIYNPMDRERRWAFAHACPAGSGLMVWWGWQQKEQQGAQVQAR